MAVAEVVVVGRVFPLGLVDLGINRGECFVAYDDLSIHSTCAKEKRPTMMRTRSVDRWLEWARATGSTDTEQNLPKVPR